MEIEKKKLNIMVMYTGDKPPKDEDIKGEGTIVMGNKVIEIEGVNVIEKQKVDKLP